MSNDRHKHGENIVCNTESWETVGYRYSQEDRFIIAPVGHGTIAAVMDGHGGVEAADMVMENMVADFSREFRRLYELDDKRNWLTIKEERMVMRRTVAKLVKRCRSLEAGTTLSFVYTHAIISDGADEPTMRTHIAILGDSPVAILNGNRTTVMPIHSARHHKSDKKKIDKKISNVSLIMRERKRQLRDREVPMMSAATFDGYVYTNRNSWDSRGLAMTRAIGDADFGDLLIRTADIRTYDLPIDAVILIATDGIEDNGLTDPIKDQCKWILDRVKTGDRLESIGSRISPSHDNTTMLTMRFSEVSARWR